MQEGGIITAGISSQNCDGAAALLVASERAVKEHNLKPRARVHHISVRADDPVWMLTAPIPATEYALKKAGMTVDDIDLFECNEAFASVPMAWMKELGIPHEKVNIHGGGIALGHPLGATGARIRVVDPEDASGEHGDIGVALVRALAAAGCGAPEMSGGGWTEIPGRYSGPDGRRVA